MTYVSGLPGSSKLDRHASAKEKARGTAWNAHAASALGDLVVRVGLLHPRTKFNFPLRHTRSIPPPTIGNLFDRRLHG